MPPEKNNHLSLIVGVVVLVILGGVIYMYLQKIKNVEKVSSSPETTTSEDVTSTASLGSELYIKASKPLDDKIPSQTTTANPIDDAYTNPFK